MPLLSASAIITTLQHYGEQKYSINVIIKVNTQKRDIFQKVLLSHIIKGVTQ